MSKLSGTVVIISGAAKGQGRSHAIACAQAGAAVVLGDVDVPGVSSVADRLRQEGHNASSVELDVSVPSDWEAAVTLAVNDFGHVNGLVNNAGIESAGDVETTTEADWARTIAVNQTGVFLGMRHTTPAIRESGGGSIVNVASTLGFYASKSGFAYQATKGAIRMMSKSAALALAPHGIRVNTVLPGLVDTPFLDPHRATGALDDSIARTPLGRIARPEEISAAVLFLLSDESSYMTGSELVVDGGMTVGSTRSLQSASAPAVGGEA